MPTPTPTATPTLTAPTSTPTLPANGKAEPRVLRQTYVPGLDGFRAIAIAWVFLSHLWTYPRETPLLNTIASAGWGAVDMFFVLSGFLITRILFAAAGRPDYYRHFYTRRVRRILPVYYLLLVIVFLGFPLVSQSAALLEARHDWLWYALFLSNVLLAEVGWQVFVLDISWSLAIEEQFYLTWPVIARKLGPRGLTAICVALIVGIPPLRAWLFRAGLVSAVWLDLSTLFRLDSIALGALLAAQEHRLPRFTTRWSVALMIVGAVGLWLTFAGAMDRSGFGAASYGHSIVAIGSALLIVGSLTKASWVARVLSVRPLRAFGKVSYGLYLYHAVVLATLSTMLSAIGLSLEHLSAFPVFNGVLQLSLVTVLAYGASWLSFAYYETPLLRARSSGAVPATAEDARRT